MDMATANKCVRVVFSTQRLPDDGPYSQPIWHWFQARSLRDSPICLGPSSAPYGVFPVPKKICINQQDEDAEFDMPHLIMTYTALLSLSILRDDFSRLDRPGILKFLRACQRADGRLVDLIF
jgi:hypothetical protein